MRLAEAVVELQEVPVVSDLAAGERYGPFGPERQRVGGEVVLLDDTLNPFGHDPAEAVEVFVSLGGEDLGQRGAGGGHRKRIAVEGADLIVGAVGDAAHDLL